MSPAIAARLKAFGAHLLLSATIIGLFMLLVFSVWYPAPFDAIYEVWDVLRLVVGVDLIIGPLLTLVIFNIAKPRRELARDVSIIILLQLSALGWGGWSTYQGRPVYVVYAAGQFQPVHREDYRAEGMDEALLSSPFTPPQLVYLRPPLDQAEAERLVLDYMNDRDLEMLFHGDRYQPLQRHMARMRDSALKPTELLGRESVARFLEGRDGQAIIFHRFSHAYIGGLLALSSESGEVLGFVRDQVE